MDLIILRIRVRRAREARRRHELYQSRVRKIELRDRSDPFSTPEDEFRKYFRLPKALVRTLIEQISPFLTQPQRSTAIPHHLKVLCALQFFGHGSYQRPTGKDFDLCLSQPSVSRCIDEVITAMSAHLLREHVRFPLTREERQALILKNFTASSIPGVLGYVDGTHVALRRPVEREDAYVNRHGYHSMNCQITCDSDLIILNTLARFPGATNDSYIWASSALRRKMVDIFRGGEICWLLGDSGYPQEPWLHIPLPEALPNTREMRYTNLHCSARNAVERCIGVLKGRFLCLSRLRTLDYHPVKVGQMFNACAILHNICVRARLPDPEPLQDDHDDGLIPDDDGERDEELEAELREIGRPGANGRPRPALLVEGERIRHQYLIAQCNPAVEE